MFLAIILIFSDIKLFSKTGGIKIYIDRFDLIYENLNKFNFDVNLIFQNFLVYIIKNEENSDFLNYITKLNGVGLKINIDNGLLSFIDEKEVNCVYFSLLSDEKNTSKIIYLSENLDTNCVTNEKI